MFTTIRRCEGILAGAILLGLIVTGSISARGQGCVAVRGGGMCMTHGVHHPDSAMDELWNVGVFYRWLHSDRHFVGDREQPQRQELGNEVINDSHFIDLVGSYQFTPRLSVGLTLPFVHSDRSSLYEHDRRNRHHSQAGGLGDVRVAGSVWLWDPLRASNGNVQVSLGFKAPSGDSAATDTFQSTNGPVVGFVDQSIQPGDGGWGVTLEFQAWRRVYRQLTAYAQGFYLFNPQDENGTSTVSGTRRGNPYEQVTSIPDQYLLRAGLAHPLYAPWGLDLTLGARVEGVPVEDVLGDSNGFRRPGFAVSIEPGLSLMRGSWSFSLTAPVALYRNRERSLADQRFSDDTGVYRHGDAAFADFIITAGIQRRF